MSVRVIGLDKAIKDLRKKFDGAERVIVGVLEDTAASIEIDAKMDAPSEIGGVILNIKQKIDKIPSNGGLTWTIGVQGTQDFDAYVEFGTGQSAREILNSPGYTPEMRAIAWEFRKNLQGTLRGVPYLMPNWIKHTANLVEELKKEIADSVR